MIGNLSICLLKLIDIDKYQWVHATSTGFSGNSKYLFVQYAAIAGIGNQ